MPPPDHEPPVPDGAELVVTFDSGPCAPGGSIPNEDCLGDAWTEGCSGAQGQQWLEGNGTSSHNSYYGWTDYRFRWVTQESFQCDPFPPGGGTIGKVCCRLFGETWRVYDEPPEEPDCEQPEPRPDAAPDAAQRDKTIDGSGFKKNNPGCDCCPRVLIWDLGRYAVRGQEGQGQGSRSGYDFIDWAMIQGWFEEKGRKYPVDFVTGGAHQGLGYYQGNSEFDPYEYAVEEGFWTGDIRDYDLIIWPFPADDTDLDGVSLPCPYCVEPTEVYHRTQNGEPDHQFWGGVPDWWEIIERGEWNGRLMWITGANARKGQYSFHFNPLGLIGYASNLFLNTLTDTHGMLVNVDAMDTSGWQEDEPPNTFHPVEEPRIDDSIDLMDKVDTLWPLEYTAEVTGGETLVQSDGEGNQIVTSPFWCDSESDATFTHDYDIVQRNRVEFEDTGNITDFIIAGTANIVPQRMPDDVEQTRSFKQFYFNLMEVPLKEEDTVSEE